jgi:hypothetical protein
VFRAQPEREPPPEPFPMTSAALVTVQPPPASSEASDTEPPRNDERPLPPPIGEAVDPEASSTTPAAAPAEASNDDDTPKTPEVSPDGKEQPSASDPGPTPSEGDGQPMMGKIEEAQQPGPSASMREALDSNADEVPKQRLATSPRSTAAVSSLSNDSILVESWVGRVRPDVTCSAPRGVCRYDSCAASGRCVSAQSQVAVGIVRSNPEGGLIAMCPRPDGSTDQR